LASAWHVGPGGHEIRIDLRPDVRFHDGSKLSAVDVQFSLDAARRPHTGADFLRALLADVVAVEIANSRTVRISLSRPNGYVLRALAAVPILPEHVYLRKLSPTRGPVVGTGPYKLVYWRDDVVRLERFPDYWGDAPAIPDIEFAYEPDSARALTAAKRNELDLVPALIAEHHPEQPSAPGLARSFVPIRLRPATFRYLAMDVREPPLDDVRVRHAIALLVDRKTIVKKIHDGLARPVAGPVWPGGPGDGASPAAPEHDPAEAGRLLDAAGWRDTDGDGHREREGGRLRVSLLALDREDTERKMLVDSLRRAGFFVEVRRGTPAVLMNRLRSGDFDLAMLDWRGAVDQSLAPLLETGGSLNFGHFSDKSVDRELAALRAAWEPPSRTPHMAGLAAAFAKTWPIVPITAPDPYGLIHKRVRGAVVWNGWISLRRLSLEQAAE
jgi:peptide/nickel transport system substrate-binding protein